MENMKEGWALRWTKREVLTEVWMQLTLSGPLIVGNVFQFCLQMISEMFVGHLGQLSLAGAAMAATFASIVGFSFLIGMGSALDTLCGQAYGAKQYHMLSVHMQRSMIVLLLMSIPLAFILAFTCNILAAMGQDREISKEAGIYARWMIPGLFAFALLQSFTRFMQAQSIVIPLMASSGVTTLCHLILCWFLVFKSGLGSKGAALATSISYWINVVLLALYIKISTACKETWTGLSMEALQDLGHFLRIGIPSTVMACLETWSFDMIVILSGLLPNPKLETSVLSISLDIYALAYMIPSGLSGAISTRISNELGARQPQAARLAARIATCMAFSNSVVTSSMTIIVRGLWGYLYTNDQQIIKHVAKIMPLIAISIFMEGIQCVLSGIARGCGWQKLGAVINLGAYYVVGLPVAILLVFVFHEGGKGFWIGIICGLVVQLVLLSIITLCSNWEEEARRANERVFSSEMPPVEMTNTSLNP
ncbi:protein DETOXIFICATION 16 isoform X1 [Amborella trichopoda]|uniref:protein DETOXIFICATION 16 isoform X1 n=1 Tax=Amborella trichopoda TaxID=13333 RepID=UPI0009C04F44|nr:protein DETOXIFICATION 16 isoform X1 [Amborella trichopoda]XP_020530314.1 protein DETOXIFICATION 16 isoform X1 [Amborella trichopoda]|eukprot:XP_020530313.1 protein DETOXIFICATION 16 isoform X1 [Amborella trichopoda]